jgi:hypothetical protein
MGDHREAPAANEKTGATGIELTRGGQRINAEDRERRAYLDAQMAGYRSQARRARINMRVVGKRRREMEPA